MNSLINSKEFGNKYHRQIEKLLLKLDFNVKSNFDKEGSDIIATHKIIQDCKVIVQCKATSKKQELYPSLSRLRDEYSRKRQKEKAIVAILALGGYSIPSNFLIEKSIREDKVIIWTDSAVKYYEELVRLIHHYAIYQVLSDFYSHVNVSPKNNEEFFSTRYIEFKQNNYRMYLCTLPPEILLKVCSVKRKFSIEHLEYYQRMLGKNRIQKNGEIPDYIERDDSILPTNIICISHPGVNIKRYRGKIIIPYKTGTFWLVDGQHRVFAFSNLSSVRKEKILANYNLPCVIVDGNDFVLSKEGKIFIDINNNAKTIPQALLLELFPNLGLPYRELTIVNKLSKTGMFKHRIRRYRSNFGEINLTTFVKNYSIKKLLSDDGFILKGLKNQIEKKKEKESYKVLYGYFKQINKHFIREWKKDFIIMSDIGIRTLLNLLLKIFKSKYKNDIPKIVKSLKKHLTHNELKIIKYKGKYAGEGGAESLAQEWSQLINMELPGFFVTNKEEIVERIYIEEGKKEIALNFIKNCLSRFEKDIVGRLNFCDPSTFEYLIKYIKKSKISSIRLIIDVLRKPDICKKIINDASNNGINIQVCLVNKNRKEGAKIIPIAVSHNRWIGDSNYQLLLETDFKKDSLANKDHEIKLVSWNQHSLSLKQFESDWLIYSKFKDRFFTFIGKDTLK